MQAYTVQCNEQLPKIFISCLAASLKYNSIHYVLKLYQQGNLQRSYTLIVNCMSIKLILTIVIVFIKQVFGINYSHAAHTILLI